MSRLNLTSSINRNSKFNIETVSCPSVASSLAENESNKTISKSNSVVELNVGGVYYATTITTLLSEPDSLFVDLFSTFEAIKITDSKNKVFFDRDGVSICTRFSSQQIDYITREL